MSTPKKMQSLTLLCLIFLIAGCSIGIGGSTSVATKSNSTDTVTSKVTAGEVPAVYKAVVVKVEGPVSEKWIQEVYPIFTDPQCKTIILWIDSPGGDVTTTKIVAHKLELLKYKYHKYLFVFSEKLLASGAYWVASIADEIIAAPSAYVGSIGVYMIRVDARRYYDLQGITLHYIASDSNKVRGNSSSGMTTEEQKYWQKHVNEIHDEFMSVVWTHRATPLVASFVLLHENIQRQQYTQQETEQLWKGARAQFREVADGSIYTTRDAYLYGLIDRCMYFDGLITLFDGWHYTVYNTSGDLITDLYIEPSKDKKKVGLFGGW